MNNTGTRIKVAFEQDEWYPVFTLKEIKDTNRYGLLDLPKKQFRRYKKVMEEYDKLHNYLRDLAEKQNII